MVRGRAEVRKCTQCGNCCTGGPGYVWISDGEIDRLAKHFHLSRQEAIERFCRRGRPLQPQGKPQRTRPVRLHLPQGAARRAVGWPGRPFPPRVRNLRSPADPVPHLAVLGGQPRFPRRTGARRPPLPRHRPRKDAQPREDGGAKKTQDEECVRPVVLHPSSFISQPQRTTRSTT